jgi:hypothetical protein
MYQDNKGENVSKLTELINEVKLLERKAYSLKTKQARQKVWDKIRELENQAYPLLQDIADQYNDKPMSGTVIYVDNQRGHGLIEIPELNIKLDFHSCNATNTCTWFPETCCVEFTEGQTVSFILKADVGDLQVDLSISKIDGGYQNLERFNELNKNNDLSFVVLKDKETGLFK